MLTSTIAFLSVFLEQKPSRISSPDLPGHVSPIPLTAGTNLFLQKSRSQLIHYQGAESPTPFASATTAEAASGTSQTSGSVDHLDASIGSRHDLDEVVVKDEAAVSRRLSSLGSELKLHSAPLEFDGPTNIANCLSADSTDALLTCELEELARAASESSSASTIPAATQHQHITVLDSLPESSCPSTTPDEGQPEVALRRTSSRPRRSSFGGATSADVLFRHLLLGSRAFCSHHHALLLWFLEKIDFEHFDLDGLSKPGDRGSITFV
jgi:hypothetical protein